VLRPLFCQVDLELPAILLVLLNEWLILVRDIVVVQIWPLVKPVWQVRDRRLHNLEGAVVRNILAIRAQNQVLLHLAVLAKWRLQANVVEGCHLVPVGDVLDVVDGPLG
jgi:hypothetical protein